VGHHGVNGDCFQGCIILKSHCHMRSERRFQIPFIQGLSEAFETSTVSLSTLGEL